MLSSEGNENGEKTTIGLNSKKATLQVQHTFFVHFFATVLHDYKVKLPETSWLHILHVWWKCRTCSCSLFFSLPLIFTFGHWYFSFPQCRYKFFMLSFQQRKSALFFISRSSSLSLFFSLSFTGLSPRCVHVLSLSLCSKLWTWQLI